MPKIDLTVFVNNDPSFIFNLSERRGRQKEPSNLTGALLECYVKKDAATPDTAAKVYKSPTEIELLDAAQGRVAIHMDSDDVGNKDRQFYHLDVVRNGRRQTYAWGLLKKLGFT